MVLAEEAIKPLYITAHPNDPILLFREYDLELRTPRLIFGKGNIEFRWSPIKSVRFELDPIAGTNIFRLDALVGQDAILNVPTNPPISWDVRINKTHGDLTVGRPPTGNLGGLVYVTRFNEDVLCDELKFHIVNLHDYFGTWITYSSNESAARRIVLSDDNWEITIDGVENLKELLKGLDREGGFAITHVGVLRQKERRPFKVAEAIEQMRQLGFFLTFVEGRWCFPVFLVGTHNGEIVFRDLSAKDRIDQWGGNWRWSPSEAKYLGDAYTGFVSKWNGLDWGEPIAIILEFYVRANTYPTTEFSVLDSFTALDRLASAYSLEKVTPAAKRIRQALAKGGLDGQSPEKELYTFYEDFYKKNCPSAP